MLVVYTGNGKGKTSAAIGAVFRAINAGKKVGYIQFLKSESNDASQLKKYFPDVEFHSFGTRAFVDPKNIKQNAKKEAEKGWEKTLELLDKKDLIVLDELCVALSFNLINKEKVIDTLKQFAMPNAEKPSHCKWPVVICTGIYSPKELTEIADLVTEMKEIKHPYKKGYLAAHGFDY